MAATQVADQEAVVMAVSWETVKTAVGKEAPAAVAKAVEMKVAAASTVG